LEQTTRTLVQCDFDGTVTDRDVGLLLLDAFVEGDWRGLWRQYHEGKITVGHFNTETFAMMKADKKTMLEHIEGKLEIRSGFYEMVDYCRGRGFRFVIVSNGFDFYVEKILEDIGMRDIELFCAKSHFGPDGGMVQYIGPDGKPLDSDFKQTYVRLFLADGYRIIYVGNGDSDFPAAKQCHHIFATGTLLARCEKEGVACMPFTDFSEVVRGMESL